ncbi:MAG: Holliday junction branch migration protein RuvA [Oscillospiraceae bacterium]
MFYCLTGKILNKNVNEVILDVGGVGFQIAVPSSTLSALPPVGEKATVYTHLNVKEDGLDLYGFADTKTQNSFKMLIGVSGVGPKVALGILSYLTPENVTLAIQAGDHKTFTQCPGIGPKLAQRLVLELHDKVGKQTQTPSNGQTVADMAVSQQAVSALVQLGYGQTEAASAVAAQDQNLPISETIRLALRALAKNK